MTFVRQRRHQQALTLSLPPPTIPESYRFYNRIHMPAVAAFCPDSPATRDQNLSNLQKVAVLGHGNGGIVYKVYDKKKQSFYALKVIRFNENIANGIKQQAHLEAEILKRVDSPYIVRCHALFDHGVDETGTAGEICFSMEYMEGGSLVDLLQAHHRLPEEVISILAKRVLEGLKYLHGMQIVHRDIKPSNLLVNVEGEVKIADFGASHMVASNFRARDSSTGTCAYMSPERFDPENWDGDNADEFAGDVWSFGVVMLECLVGHFPLIDPDQKPDWATLMCAISFGERLEVPEMASPEFESFVGRCLEKDWRKRGTVVELLAHPFVNGNHFCSTKGLVDYVLHS